MLIVFVFLLFGLGRSGLCEDVWWLWCDTIISCICWCVTLWFHKQGLMFLSAVCHCLFSAADPHHKQASQNPGSKIKEYIYKWVYSMCLPDYLCVCVLMGEFISCVYLTTCMCLYKWVYSVCLPDYLCVCLLISEFIPCVYLTTCVSRSVIRISSSVTYPYPEMSSVFIDVRYESFNEHQWIFKYGSLYHSFCHCYFVGVNLRIAPVFNAYQL